jgi:hypothetical protein
LFKVEAVCSAIASSMGNAPRSSKRDSFDVNQGSRNQWHFSSEKAGN